MPLEQLDEALTNDSGSAKNAYLVSCLHGRIVVKRFWLILDYSVGRGLTRITAVNACFYSQRGQDACGKGFGATVSAHIAGECLLLDINLLERSMHSIRGANLAKVAQHQDGGLQQRGWVRDVLARNVGRRAVDRLEDRALGTQIRARYQAQAAHECRAQVADDVAIQIFSQQGVVLVWVHDQLHAGVVDDVLTIGDLWKAFRHLARTAQEEPVGHLHDVCLVDRVNPVALELARVFKGKLRNAGRSLLGDDLQRLHHSRNHFMLQPDILAFRVLAHDDQIDPWIAHIHTRQVLDRTEVREEFKLLAQVHIDGGETSGNRRRHWAFQGQAVALDGVVHRLRNVLAILFKGVGAH